jgi:hypothetical protein
VTGELWWAIKLAIHSASKNRKTPIFKCMPMLYNDLIRKKSLYLERSKHATVFTTIRDHINLRYNVYVDDTPAEKTREAGQ